MRRPSKSDIGNIDWQMRSHGYNTDSRPTAKDVARIVSQLTTVIFTKLQMATFLESADYAYSLRLRHKAEGRAK